MKEQPEKQQTSKSPLYGYRKPLRDEDGKLWCHCTQPTLVTNHGIGGGQAYCLRCSTNWYK